MIVISNEFFITVDPPLLSVKLRSLKMNSYAPIASGRDNPLKVRKALENSRNRMWSRNIGK